MVGAGTETELLGETDGAGTVDELGVGVGVGLSVGEDGVGVGVGVGEGDGLCDCLGWAG